MKFPNCLLFLSGLKFFLLCSSPIENIQHMYTFVHFNSWEWVHHFLQLIISYKHERLAMWSWKQCSWTIISPLLLKCYSKFFKNMILFPDNHSYFLRTLYSQNCHRSPRKSCWTWMAGPHDDQMYRLHLNSSPDFPPWNW